MRILFINWSRVEFAGGEKHLLSLIREMMNAGIEAMLLCPTGSPLAQRATARGIPVTETALDYFKKTRPWPYISSVISVHKIVKRFQPDAIHAQSANSLHWLLPFAWFSNIPIGCQIQDFEIYQRFPLWTLRRIPVSFAASEVIRKHAIGTFKVSVNKCLTVWQGIENLPKNTSEQVRAMRKDLGLGSSDIAVGICGRIHPRKGQHLFIEAAALLKKEASIKWIIAGDRTAADIHYLKELDAMIKKHGLDSQVRFTGFISDMSVFLRALDIIAVPSQDEPLGLISVEAQAAGRPAVVSASGGMPESVEDGRTGIVMRNLDADELSYQVAKLANHPEMRRRMGKAGQERFARYFTIRANAERIMRLYCGLTGR
jgi:glycosyltransferase involved in cell wall biosynthesis